MKFEKKITKKYSQILILEQGKHWGCGQGSGTGAGLSSDLEKNDSEIVEIILG